MRLLGFILANMSFVEVSFRMGLKGSWVWIVEKKDKKRGWIPHELFDWFSTKKEARKVSSRDVELRAVRYERVRE
jgi:hypothetical protein